MTGKKKMRKRITISSFHGKAIRGQSAAAGFGAAVLVRAAVFLLAAFFAEAFFEDGAEPLD
jgi:hypothetical protein